MGHDAGIWYRINGKDEIIEVGGNWDLFSENNGGQGLEAETLRGHVLWKFVTGTTTRDLYKRLLTRVRSGQLVRFKLRCDGPTHRRLLEMTIRADGDQSVEFATRDLEVTERESIAMLVDSGTRSTAMLVVCAWCNRVQVRPQVWMEVELAIEQLDLFEADGLPQVTHGICDDCLESMTELVEQMEQGE